MLRREHHPSFPLTRFIYARVSAFALVIEKVATFILIDGIFVVNTTVFLYNPT